MKKEQSDYGKGLCYCLGLFLAHSDRFTADLETWRKMRKKSPRLFSDSSACHMWMNGASDHLSELQIQPAPQKLWRRLKMLQRKCVDWGHGFLKKECTPKDVYWSIQEAKDLLRLIDKSHRVKVEKGRWE